MGTVESAGSSGVGVGIGPGAPGANTAANLRVSPPAVVAPVVVTSTPVRSAVMGAAPAPVAPAPAAQPSNELGPERFYPNGIAPLRPEFLSPEPQQPPARR